MDKSDADLLREIAGRMDGSGSATEGVVIGPGVAPGWVRMTPPIPHGAAYRDYPDPAKVMNYEDQPVTTITGYANMIQEKWNCPHYDYRTQGGRLFDLGSRFNAMIQTEGAAAFPRVLDEMAFPADYATAPADGSGFSPQ